MVAQNKFAMSDLARQRRLDVDLAAGNGDGADSLTPAHTVGQAVEHFLDRMRIRDGGLRWTAFSRGVLLDSKRRLAELDETDTEITVMPEVSAG
jgi:hypothetical protein